MEKNQQQKRTEYSQINKLSLFKNLDGNKGASLKWSVRNGYPRVTVFTDNNALLPNGKLDFNKVITAPFDVITLNSILHMFRSIIAGAEKKMVTVNCYNAKYENNVKTNEVVLQGKFIFGEDDKGINYMAVAEEGKPKIKFDLLPDSKWFKFLGTNGDEIHSGISDSYATGYIELLKSALEHVIKSDITINVVDNKRAMDKVDKVATPPPTSTIEVSDDLDF